MKQKRTPASRIAFGGMLAALALVIMSLGGLIPIATYVIPMICAMLLKLVYRTCGRRIAWAWYGAVAILGILLCPDKEAAGVFVFLGYYPILKPRFDRKKFPFVWKLLYFNASIGVLYFLLLHLFGLGELSAEFSGMGKLMLVTLLLMGNVTFFLLDRLLGMNRRFRRR